MKLDAHDTEVRRLLSEGLTNQAIADRLNVSEAAVRRYRRKHGLVVAAVERFSAQHWTPDVETVSKVDLLEAELADLRSRDRARKKNTVQQERVHQAIESALSGVPLPTGGYVPSRLNHHDPNLTLPAPAKHRQAAMLSDWHAGEVVDPQQVGGLNAFDFEILEARVQEVVRALLSFKKVRPTLTGLDLWFLGDMVSGDIHEELQITNQFPAAEQAVKVGYLMGWVVAELAPHYLDLFCIGVPGNHARMPKQHASKNVHDSWDWTAYQLAKAYTRDLTNVHWEIPRAGTYIRRIAGKDILIAHGDGIRSSMVGVPEGGISKRFNALTQQYATQGRIIEGFAYGHFHNSGVRKKRLFGNGSLIGVNEHGYKNYGDGEEPTQVLLTWDVEESRLTDVSYITPTTGVNPGMED